MTSGTTFHSHRPILKHAFQIFIILPCVLIVHFSFVFSVKSLFRPSRNKRLNPFVFGRKCGQINEARNSAWKNPWVITTAHREVMSQLSFMLREETSNRALLKHNHNTCTFSMKRLEALQVGNNQKCSVQVSPALIQAVNLFTAGVEEGILSPKRDSSHRCSHFGFSCIVLVSFSDPVQLWGRNCHTLHPSTTQGWWHGNQMMKKRRKEEGQKRRSHDAGRFIFVCNSVTMKGCRWMSSCLSWSRFEDQRKAGRTVGMRGSWDAATAIWPGADIWPDPISHSLLQTFRVLW